MGLHDGEAEAAHDMAAAAIPRRPLGTGTSTRCRGCRVPVVTVQAPGMPRVAQRTTCDACHAKIKVDPVEHKG